MQYIRIKFFLNGQPVEYTVRPDQTALDLIREGLGLTGTKEGCSEGDCGACTIALGSLKDKGIVYDAVASCILPAVKLHKRHVITIEGLTPEDGLHPIQQAILENRATQCGFCTPGVIMSLFCFFSRDSNPSAEKIEAALEGNLCRCTGYWSIRQAAWSVSQRLRQGMLDAVRDILPAYHRKVISGLRSIKSGPQICQAGNNSGGRTQAYGSPRSLSELFALLKRFRSCRQYRIISGGTDVMVDMNIKRLFPEHLVDISGISALSGIKIFGGKLQIGANVTLAQIVAHPLIVRRLPALSQTASQMASAQIRNIATLAGNLANASPIADGAVLLLALGARLILLSAQGRRSASMDEFFRSYRRTCLKEHEIIARIEIPMDGSVSSIQKSAKRRAVDIATVNSAVNLKFSKGKVTAARIALGGVAPTPVLAQRSAASLIGRELTEETIARAAEMAAAECAPISDVRGGADYRRQLVQNQVIRHLKQISENKKIEQARRHHPLTPLR